MLPPAPGEPGGGGWLYGKVWGLLPSQPVRPQTWVIGSLWGGRAGRAQGSRPGSTLTQGMTLSRSFLCHLPRFPQDLDAFSRPF